MECCEVEFLAEKSLVSIIPNFTMEKLELICGNFGPFVAGMTVDVPLWVAIYLRQKHKCRLCPPSWMDIELLQETKKKEMESEVFTKMPCPHYMEVCHLIHNVAVQDVTRADEIHTLIKDILDIRLAKLRSSIDLFVKSGATHAKLNNLTVMEVNSVRRMLTSVLDHIWSLKSNTDSLSQNTLND